MKVSLLKHYRRHEIIGKLPGSYNIGLELGVAEGFFSTRAVRTTKFSKYIGIDMYADRGHDLAQYKRALKSVGLLSPYSLLKMRFDEALDLFEDHTFDFIYVDGYAHTGEENGQTFYDWWPKLKPGGMFAGDDYDRKKWPQVYNNVNKFCEDKGIDELFITGVSETNAWSRYPSWMVWKPQEPSALESTIV